MCVRYVSHKSDIIVRFMRTNGPIGALPDAANERFLSKRVAFERA